MSIVDDLRTLDTSDPGRWPLPNVWLGVSVENQRFADERIPLLLETPAAVRFISAEPLLGPIDVRWRSADGGGFVQYLPAPGPPDPPNVKNRRPYLNWVITGGESGPKARPCRVEWIADIVRQCQASHVPVFVKQLGSNVEDRNDAGFEGDPGDRWTPETRYEELTSEGWQGDPVRIRLRDRKGGDPQEWPEDLRVRDFPRAAGEAEG